MAYARFSEDSDVYVFLGGSGDDGFGPLALVCLKCKLPESEFAFSAGTTAQMIEHLHEHRAAGHSVPDEAFSGLQENQAENDAEIATRPDSN